MAGVVDRLVRHQGLVAAEVAVLQPVHQLVVRERVEVRAADRLRDCEPLPVERRDVQVLDVRERRATRRRPVDVERPDGELVVVGRSRIVIGHDVVVGCIRRRLCRAVRIRRQRAERDRLHVREIEVDALRARAREHRAALEGEHADAVVAGATREVVEREVVAVGPDAELLVVRQRRPHVERVAVPRVGRVVGGRDRNAHVVRRGRGELGVHPALRVLVIVKRRIAARRSAAVREARPERVVGDQPGEAVAVLAEDVDAAVDRLDVLRVTDIADRVRRVPADSEVALADAQEGRGRRGNRRRDGRGLHDWIVRRDRDTRRRLALELRDHAVGVERDVRRVLQRHGGVVRRVARDGRRGGATRGAGVRGAEGTGREQAEQQRLQGEHSKQAGPAQHPHTRVVGSPRRELEF